MLEYAFTPENRLPAGSGFSLFGPEHLGALAAVAVLSTLVVFWGCRMTRRRRLVLMRFLSGAMLLMEIAKDLTLWRIGSFGIGYLPLHLCSLDMFICLYAAWRPNSDAGGQMLWSLCFSGGLAALLFPDWTDMPIYHFQSIHSFIYHGMLLQMSLMAVITGQARPRVGRLWKVGVFLVCTAVPIYWINLRLNTNYMFLMRPVPGTPLELCAALPGRAGYLAGYAVLAAVVLVLLDLPFSLAARLRRQDGGVPGA